LEVVRGAWDFAAINRGYERYQKVLSQHPTGDLRNQGTTTALLRWGEAERKAWIQAVSNDPLLPVKLLPPDYRGQEAWRRRVEVLRETGRQLNTFKP
jgi:hypothetical protein